MTQKENWLKNYNLVRKYYEENGDLLVPYKYEVKDEEAEWYVNNEEKIFKCCGFVPLGKASVFINKIEGDYNTLLGISPSIVYNKLKELGYSFNDLNFEESLS